MSNGTCTSLTIKANLRGKSIHPNAMRYLAALLTGLFGFLVLQLSAQTDCDGADHTILAGNFYFNPSPLTINEGETVAWINEGGTHDVNGVWSTVDDISFNNPEDFSLSSVSSTGLEVCIGAHTFTVPGTYSYDCSIGNHAAQGMVGTLVVEAATPECNDPMACNYDEASTSDADCQYYDGALDISEGIWLNAGASLNPYYDCDIQPGQGVLVEVDATQGQPVTIVVTEELEAWLDDLVDQGFLSELNAVLALSAFNNADFSFCGGTIIGDAGLTTITSEWNGEAWIIQELGFSIAPAAEMPDGCPDPIAINFDPCANPDSTLCEYEVALGCNDSLACNYDSTATDSAGCNYFDTELFTLEEADFVGLIDYEDCPNGYPGANTLPIPLGQDSAGGPLFFTLSPEVEDFLFYNGFEAAAQELATVTMSVCDTVMNYNSLVFGDLDLIWDGTGFQNWIFESFVVPESSLPIGCPDPDACNFDPCVHPFEEEGCEYLDSGTVVGDTLVVEGGTATFTVTPGEGNDFEWYSDCASMEEDNETVTLTVDWDCEVCLIEYSADSCFAETCFTISTFTGILENGPLHWEFMPNPASDALRVVWGGPTAVFEVFDVNGRRVHTTTVYGGVTTLDLSSLQPGLYLAGPRGTEPKRLAIQR